MQAVHSKAKSWLVISAIFQIACWLITDLFIISDKEYEQLIRRFIQYYIVTPAIIIGYIIVY